MSTDLVEKIAHAVLYEGYLLYPYRPSALKNQHRWNFGVLYPPAWSARQTGSDRSYFQMECITACKDSAEITVSIRFLEIFLRKTDGLEWQEAAEHNIDFDSLLIATLPLHRRTERFAIADKNNASGDFAVQGQLELSAAPVGENAFRLTVRVTNTTTCAADTRDDALLHSLASAHAVLRIRNGGFVSNTDPPSDFQDAVAACQNTGVWPVLVGKPESCDTMLGSPIILSDYPQVAPESEGDLFDGTEIDEILTLRILTLTDAEKDEVRKSDDRARRILERLETSPPEHLLQLHGVMRNVREPQANAWSAWDTLEGSPLQRAAAAGVDLEKGDRVRLRPRKRADILDTLLDGRVAIIEAIEQDFENNIHFAVVLEDDPGRDLGEMRQAGHRFFFSAEEVEPLETPRSQRRGA